MRISDWSSDVCSSDLLDSLHRAQVYREMYDQAKSRGRQREPNLFRSLVGTSRAVQHVRQMMEQVADTEASVLILGESGTGKEVEIGRASCRERVCQYV